MRTASLLGHRLEDLQVLIAHGDQKVLGQDQADLGQVRGFVLTQCHHRGRKTQDAVLERLAAGLLNLAKLVSGWQWVANVGLDARNLSFGGVIEVNPDDPLRRRSTRLARDWMVCDHAR